MEKYNQDFNITINPCTGIAFNLGLMEAVTTKTGKKKNALFYL